MVRGGEKAPGDRAPRGEPPPRPGLRRGDRLPPPPRARQGRRPPARHLPLGTRAPTTPDHRGDGDGQELPRLRLCPAGLPQGISGALPPRAPALRRAHPRSCRRHLHPPPRQARPHRRPRARGLGPRAAAGPGPTRPARDPGGSQRDPVDDHHEPAPARPVARVPRGPHGGGRDLRSPPSQRPSPQAKRTLAAKGETYRALTNGQRRFAPIPMTDPRDHDGPIPVITMAEMRNYTISGVESPSCSDPSCWHEGPRWSLRDGRAFVYLAVTS